jgi:hypothetical protein
MFPVLAALAGLAAAAPPAKKPAPNSPAKPAAKAKATPKPQPTMKDLAIREARKFDTDYNGQINGIEVLGVQSEFRNNPNSRLYFFDDNSNHVLDSTEIAKIKFKPAKKPAKKE